MGDFVEEQVEDPENQPFEPLPALLEDEVRVARGRDAAPPARPPHHRAIPAGCFLGRGVGGGAAKFVSQSLSVLGCSDAARPPRTAGGAAFASNRRGNWLAVATGTGRPAVSLTWTMGFACRVYWALEGAGAVPS